MSELQALGIAIYIIISIVTFVFSQLLKPSIRQFSSVKSYLINRFVVWVAPFIWPIYLIILFIAWMSKRLNSWKEEMIDLKKREMRKK